MTDVLEAWLNEKYWSNPLLVEQHNLQSLLKPPAELMELINSGRWKYPSLKEMREKIPLIQDQLEFVYSKREMVLFAPKFLKKETTNLESYLNKYGDHHYRGSIHGYYDFPWIDVEKTLMIANLAMPGDDMGICLDYRASMEEPKVVGGNWIPGNQIVYFEISPTFREFVELIGL